MQKVHPGNQAGRDQIAQQHYLSHFEYFGYFKPGSITERTVCNQGRLVGQHSTFRCCLKVCKSSRVSLGCCYNVVWKHTDMFMSHTLESSTASSIGEQSWVLCSLEDWHTTQMGCLSTRQKSFNFSPCRVQLVLSSSSSELCLLTCKTASQTFFRAKLEGTVDLEALFLHTGHSRDPLLSQQRFRQPLQKLWLHDSKTGSVKMSQHIGHVRSSSGSDMIISLSCTI